MANLKRRPCPARLAALALMLGLPISSTLANDTVAAPSAKPPLSAPPAAPATASVADGANEQAVDSVIEQAHEDARKESITTCQLPEEKGFFGLEWARRTSFRSACLTAHWLDSKFGDGVFDAKEGKINGYVALVTDKREGDSWDLTPRLRISAKLPNVTKKLDVFFDRDKETQTIAGKTTALHPEATTPGEENTNQVGVGYELHKSVTDLLNVRVGARIRSWKPELFAQSRYFVTFANTEVDRWNFTETLFWRRHEGLGETSSLEYERHLGGPFILSWGNGATVSEATDGISWSTVLTLSHALSNDKGLQWSYGASGETKQSEPLANHGPRVTYRQRLKQRWLIFETFIGVDHLKSDASAPRQTQTYFGAKIEAHFNPP